jgi:hypothetical protein
VSAGGTYDLSKPALLPTAEEFPSRNGTRDYPLKLGNSNASAINSDKTGREEILCLSEASVVSVSGNLRTM